MLNLIAGLPPGSRVLDLGASTGSFQTERTDITVVRLDLEIRAGRAPGWYVAADAARLPFASHSFDLVISNHSLEHFPAMEDTLREVGRIIRPGGVLYIAVPDAATFTDRVYRWMARGGGHVNGFRSAGEVTAPVVRLTGLPHRATRELYSSLCFLNAHNRRGRPQIKSALFAFGNERYLAIFVWVLRWMDARFGTGLSRYGWSFYFGAADLPRKLDPWINVCVRCGSACAEIYLRMKNALPPFYGSWQWYSCPTCGARNLFTPEPSRRYD